MHLPRNTRDKEEEKERKKSETEKECVSPFHLRKTKHRKPLAGGNEDPGVPLVLSTCVAGGSGGLSFHVCKMGDLP